MFTRPRCRDWSPLATQQLRLRNLIQITGHNIQCDKNCSIYYTLHLSSMSAPFFTSEKLEITNDAIWPEINSQMIGKLSSRSVCIRIWEHDKSSDELEIKTNTTDKVLFFWGVYFSGLTLIPNSIDLQLKENSLIFHMHGGQFTSYECLKENVSYQSLALTHFKNQKEIANNDTNRSELLIATKVNTKPYGGRTDQECQNEGNAITGEPVEEKAAESSIMNRASYLKTRYFTQIFLLSEIRPSYKINKLLLLQEKQRKLKYKNESSKELVDLICTKSAFCLNLNLIANYSLHYHPRKNLGMGRTLNKLLYQQPERPDPEIILKGQSLRREIEVAKFRCRLLTLESDRARSNIRQLESKLGKICDTNIETESWLMSKYRSFSRERENFLQKKMICAGQQDVYSKVKIQLQQRRQQLLRELNDIYEIKQHDGGFYTINNISLPDAESYTDNIPALSISVALGYAAHSVQMCSVILNIPLRNEIKHEGTRSKIVDNIKILTEADRIFPLYCRVTPPPDITLYAVFLLNQNIAQLQFQLGINKRDLRATLANLMDLTKNISFELNKNIFEFNASNTSTYESSTDLNDIVSAKIFVANETKNNGHRISRSMDNYSEQTFHNFNKTVSEPILFPDVNK